MHTQTATPDTVAHAQTDAAGNETRTDASAALIPPVDVHEDATGITLVADLPGVPREQLDIRLDGDTLTIAGEIVLAAAEGMDAQHVEVALPRYERRFSLSRELDRERIDAHFEHGVLTLKIPKLAHAQTRKIAIRTH
jgi:HSP20 family molecular chaperone IbpA